MAAVETGEQSDFARSPRILSEIAFLHGLSKVAAGMGIASRSLSRLQLQKEAELGGVPGATGLARDAQALDRYF